MSYRDKLMGIAASPSKAASSGGPDVGAPGQCAEQADEPDNIAELREQLQIPHECRAAIAKRNTPLAERMRTKCDSEITHIQHLITQ